MAVNEWRNDMISLKCPVCGQTLTKLDRTLKCSSNHSFDIAKQGYVNLLMSNQSSKKHHGDDKLMVKARYDFLDLGLYTPILNGAIKLLLPISGASPKILDAGCGECWYTAGILSTLKEQGKAPDILGVDISKDALIYGAKRSRDITLAVSSVSNLPVHDESIDILLNFFAPFTPDEYRRVLKPGGYFLRAIPLERHLYSLKKAVYDNPYLNDEIKLETDGFSIAETLDINESITLKSCDEIKNLFSMTPYYYKTGVKDQEKLNSLSYLETELSVRLVLYKKD